MGAGPIEPDDPAHAAAFDRLAGKVIAVLVATPARDLDGLRIKAEAVAWCCGSRHDFAMGEASADRVIASMLLDLLRPESAPSG